MSSDCRSECHPQPDELVEEESHTWSARLADKMIADIQRALGYLDLDPNAFTVEQLGSEQDTSEYATRSFLEMIIGFAHARKRALSARITRSLTISAARASRQTAPQWRRASRQ